MLVASDAPFTWGKTVTEAVRHSVVLEEIASLAFHTMAANAEAQEISRVLQDKHFDRKHGCNAYYGQPKS